MVIIKVGAHNPLELDTQSFKVKNRKEVTGLLHMLGVVEPTLESVVKAKQVASSMDKKVTS